MSEPIDELFGDSDGAPQPRTMTIILLLGAGLLTAVVGMACTAVPGGVLVLLAWMLAEKEVDRIDSGYLPDTARPAVSTARAATMLGVFAVIILFALQGLLFCSGAYDGLWGSMLLVIAGASGA